MYYRSAVSLAVLLLSLAISAQAQSLSCASSVNQQGSSTIVSVQCYDFNLGGHSIQWSATQTIDSNRLWRSYSVAEYHGTQVIGNSVTLSMVECFVECSPLVPIMSYADAGPGTYNSPLLDFGTPGRSVQEIRLDGIYTVQDVSTDCGWSTGACFFQIDVTLSQ